MDDTEIWQCAVSSSWVVDDVCSSGLTTGWWWWWLRMDDTDDNCDPLLMDLDVIYCNYYTTTGEFLEMVVVMVVVVEYETDNSRRSTSDLMHWNTAAQGGYERRRRDEVRWWWCCWWVWDENRIQMVLCGGWCCWNWLEWMLNNNGEKRQKEREKKWESEGEEEGDFLVRGIDRENEWQSVCRSCFCCCWLYCRKNSNRQVSLHAFFSLSADSGRSLLLLLLMLLSVVVDKRFAMQKWESCVCCRLRRRRVGLDVRSSRRNHGMHHDGHFGETSSFSTKSSLPIIMMLRIMSSLLKAKGERGKREREERSKIPFLSFPSPSWCSLSQVPPRKLRISWEPTARFERPLTSYQTLRISLFPPFTHS